MSTIVDRVLARAKQPRKKKAMLGWLIHATPGVEGLTHWLVVASSLEDAVASIREMPCALGHKLELGYLIEPANWPDFARRPLKECCAICTPAKMHDWDEMVRNFADYAAMQQRCWVES